MTVLNFLTILFSWFLFFGKSPAPAVSDEITWKPNRRLTWDDFRAKPDNNDKLHALTASNIDMKAKCENNELKIKVKSFFSANESWSKNKKSERLLFHEQLHFDITEIYARQLRKDLKALKDPCNNSAQLNKITDHVFETWKKREDQYDHETNHGLDEVQMAVWAKIVEKELKDLENYQED